MTKQERNEAIFAAYQRGVNPKEIAKRHYLRLNSIYEIAQKVSREKQIPMRKKRSGRPRLSTTKESRWQTPASKRE